MLLQPGKLDSTPEDQEGAAIGTSRNQGRTRALRAQTNLRPEAEARSTAKTDADRCAEWARSNLGHRDSTCSRFGWPGSEAADAGMHGWVFCFDAGGLVVDGAPPTPPPPGPGPPPRKPDWLQMPIMPQYQPKYAW